MADCKAVHVPGRRRTIVVVQHNVGLAVQVEIAGASSRTFLHLALVMLAAAGTWMPRRRFRASRSAGMSGGKLSSNRATRRTPDMRSWCFWLGNKSIVAIRSSTCARVAGGLNVTSLWTLMDSGCL
jgi:hypothetical protein